MDADHNLPSAGAGKLVSSREQPAFPFPTPWSHMTMTTISVSELHSLFDQEDAALILIDVRTPAEFEEAHVPGAKNFPLEGLDAGQLIRSGELLAQEPVYILCRSGKRAVTALKQFQEAGFSYAHLVEGGTLAWAAENYPLHRQVEGEI